ncbi:MAG TPA: thioredoxin family protein [Candidatus Butyricimonas faecavium]|nr:thioredoxin family protein [Candidatus Butyricimonas faecavium]
MKKLVIVLNLVCMFTLVSFAQSMYGDAVKADVKMKYVYSFEEALKKAKGEHKLIFFNCFADWAIPCHSMNKLVFSNQEFADWMDKHFVNLFIDVTQPEGRPLAEKYHIRFQAHYLVLDENGQIVHRIVGGYQIPEFKAILEKALNPKTSLAGMNKRYEAGERSAKFLGAYADILRVADQDGEMYAKVIGELFSKLKKKEWSKREYWKFFTRQLESVNDEMFKYMVENKTDFVKSNGAEKVNQIIVGLYFREIYPYASGKKVYDGNELLNIYLDMQKAGIIESHQVYPLYEIARCRGEGQFDKMMDVFENKLDLLPEQTLTALDLTLPEIKDLDKKEQRRVVTYLKQRAETSSAKKYYLAAINDMVNTDGIKFEESSFEEALKKAKDQGKLLFMDCYTTWCGPCKMMSNQVFKQKFVGDFFNQNLVSLKVDMEKGEGKDLQRRFEVKAFPTMFLLNGDGNIIYKILGGRDTREFMEAIQRGMKCTPYYILKNKYEAGDRSVELMADYFQTMSDAGELKNVDSEVKSYLATLKAPESYSVSAWALYDNFVNRVSDAEFKFLVNNRKELAKQVGDSVVDKKIERVVFPVVIDYLKGAVSKENMDQVWKLVNSAQFSPEYSLTLLHKIISMYDKKEYDKMLDFYEKTVTSNQDAKVRLNLDVILHRLVKNASSEQKAKAIAYAKKSMENAKPEAQGSYKALIEALSE